MAERLVVYLGKILSRFGILGVFSRVVVDDNEPRIGVNSNFFGFRKVRLEISGFSGCPNVIFFSCFASYLCGAAFEKLMKMAKGKPCFGYPILYPPVLTSYQIVEVKLFY